MTLPAGHSPRLAGTDSSESNAVPYLPTIFFLVYDDCFILGPFCRLSFHSLLYFVFALGLGLGVRKDVKLLDRNVANFRMPLVSTASWFDSSCATVLCYKSEPSENYYVGPIGSFGITVTGNCSVSRPKCRKLSGVLNSSMACCRPL
jgi:hypothetical protein